METGVLGFSVRIAMTDDDFHQARTVRAAAYGHHDPQIGSRFGAADPMDRAEGTVVLLCRDKQTGAGIGTARIQVSGFGPLLLENSMTLREWLANNLASQPEPLDVFSFHFYGSTDLAEPWSFWKISADDLLRSMTRAVHAARSPLFIGELGQTKPDFKTDQEGKWTCAAIDLLEQEGVSLAALWVWHFPWQPELTVNSTSHPKLVKRIGDFNRKHAGLK